MAKDTLPPESRRPVPEDTLEAKISALQFTAVKREERITQLEAASRSQIEEIDRLNGIIRELETKLKVFSE